MTDNAKTLLTFWQSHNYWLDRHDAQKLAGVDLTPARKELEIEGYLIEKRHDKHDNVRWRMVR